MENISFIGIQKKMKSKLIKDIKYALTFADMAKEYLDKGNIWYAMGCMSELDEKCNNLLVKLYGKEYKDFDDAVKKYERKCL